MNSKESEMSSTDSETDVGTFDEDKKQSQSPLEENGREESVKSSPKVCLMWVRILYQQNDKTSIRNN